MSSPTLMEAVKVKYQSLGQLAHAFYLVGSEYRRKYVTNWGMKAKRLESGLRTNALQTKVAGLATVAVAVGALFSWTATSVAQSGTVTFTRDVAPILFQHCVTCHRLSGVAPFSLLTYDEARPRATAIASATERRAMPPWKPDSAHGEFVGDRRLADEQISRLRRWADTGAPEGAPGDRPDAPAFAFGWQAGEPDLIVEIPPGYALPAGGDDVFRHFAVPVPLSRARYVRAWEFRPANSKIVHHATIQLDTTSASRHHDERDPRPGYEGLVPHTVQNAEGFFLGWTPGQGPSVAPPDTAWRIDKGTDLVVMLHLRPIGMDTPVGASLGLYFTDVPPTRDPLMLRLNREDIDIPAGAREHQITDKYVLPVDVEVLSVQPHAHYLCRDVKAVAELPDGTTRTLIHIKNWDFDWQDVYRYARPISLPAGTTVVMQFTYDNSPANSRNPRSPPQRVRYGQRTTDEMGELWLQLVTSAANRPALARSLNAKGTADSITGYKTLIAGNPGDRTLHDDLALLYIRTGNAAMALQQFEESLRIAPDSASAHNNVGLVLLSERRSDEAAKRFREAIAIDPRYALALVNLGIVEQSAGRLDQALAHYTAAIAADGRDAEAHYRRGSVLNLQNRTADAVSAYERALELRPAFPEARAELAIALRAELRFADAVVHFEKALQSSVERPGVLINYAWLLATSPDPAIRNAPRAVELSSRGLALLPSPTVLALDALAAAHAATGEFERAVATAERALALATESRNPQVIAAIRARLELYKVKRAYTAPR